MTAPHPSPAGLSPLLDQLDEARAKGTPGEWYTGDSALGIAIYSDSESRPGIGQTYMPADAALIVAAVNALPQLVAALRAVLDVHGAIDAVQYLSTRQVPRRVCTGCGSDDGNWQAWPCPTVRALADALTPGADTAGATA